MLQQYIEGKTALLVRATAITLEDWHIRIEIEACDRGDLREPTVLLWDEKNSFPLLQYGDWSAVLR